MAYFLSFLVLMTLVVVGVWARNYYSPQSKLRRAVQKRLFAESPTFVIDNFSTQIKSPGLYQFRVEGCIVGIDDGLLELRFVEGVHDGVTFQQWKYEQPPTLELSDSWKEMYHAKPT